jgi:hypothetical protein
MNLTGRQPRTPYSPVGDHDRFSREVRRAMIPGDDDDDAAADPSAEPPSIDLDHRRAAPTQVSSRHLFPSAWGLEHPSGQWIFGPCPESSPSFFLAAAGRGVAAARVAHRAGCRPSRPRETRRGRRQPWLAAEVGAAVVPRRSELDAHRSCAESSVSVRNRVRASSDSCARPTTTGGQTSVAATNHLPRKESGAL